MKNHLLYLVKFIIIAFVFASCATTGNDFSRTTLSDITKVDVQADPTFRSRNYQTFTIISASNFYEKIKLNEIEEQYVILFVRSQMEEKGFKYVSSNNNPDIIICVDADNTYEKTYIPPKNINVPKYEPGSVSTTYGSVDTSSFNATTYKPGKWTSETITSGGYEIGNYYAFSIIWVFDGVNKKNIWRGSALGTSKVSDVRVSNQNVICSILDKFPNQSKGKLTDDMIDKGGLGFKYKIWTLDGNNFFPVVIELGKSAEQAGLLLNDIILSVDDISVINMTLSDTWNLIRGKPGTTAKLEILSRGEIRIISISRIN